MRRFYFVLKHVETQTSLGVYGRIFWHGDIIRCKLDSYFWRFVWFAWKKEECVVLIVFRNYVPVSIKWLQKLNAGFRSLSCIKWLQKLNAGFRSLSWTLFLLLFYGQKWSSSQKFVIGIVLRTEMLEFPKNSKLSLGKKWNGVIVTLLVLNIEINLLHSVKFIGVIILCKEE